MTDKPHTPTTARVKDDYRRGRVWESGNGSEAYDKEFDRWLATVEAAAEQRGAEQGWDLAIDYAWDDSSIYEADAKRAKAANPYRADQMEGDE